VKSLLQTRAWANLKVSQGWQSHEIDGIFVLEKPLSFGQSFLYAPEVNFSDIKNLQNFNQKIKEFTQKSPAIFFRLEILDKLDEEIVKKLCENGFIKAFEELQPEWRQIIDISGSEEEILTQMKQKGRYNIKIAQKHGVKIERVKEENLLEGVDTFYNLFLQTSKNQRFSVRPKKYFQNLVFRLYTASYADLFLAYFNEVPIAGLIITYYDAKASYLYGASSPEFRNVMAPYLAHWEAILAAKVKGCKTYDLLAVSPADGLQQTANGEDEAVSRKPGAVSHKYTGITRFKEQFGGKKINITGSYDLIFKPTWYKFFKMAEQYRRK
jgi:lipid II:glycine glycyltransferase (peptidoglycan interpeptide bridge formation enzyme)